MKEIQIVSLKVIDNINCSFCQDKLGDHSHKNLKRHFYKTLNAAVASQRFINDLYAEFSRVQIELLIYKKKFGDMAIEEMEKIKEEVMKEMKELEEKQKANDAKVKEIQDGIKINPPEINVGGVEKEIADHYEHRGEIARESEEKFKTHTPDQEVDI